MNKNNLIKIGAVSLGVLIVFPWFFFRVNTSPTSKDSEQVRFSVSENYTYSTLGSKLEEEGLIRSEFFYKALVRAMRPDRLEVCTYTLDKNMGTLKIIEVLERGCKSSSEAITLRVPEGRNINQIAAIVEQVTTNSKEDVIRVWNSAEFVDEVIEKYDFVDDVIKSKDVMYPLEGYLFPSTYELANENVSPKTVAFRMLDQMGVIYERHKEDIESSGMSFHEVLTLASIVEYEAILDEDRSVVSSVFHNRLNQGWRLESCATLGYALGEWKSQYSTADTQVDHAYNTYQNSGLPPGPGGMPGEASIVAALNPSSTDYMFFLANVCDPNDNKTYFSRTNSEHNQKARQFNMRC